MLSQIGTLKRKSHDEDEQDQKNDDKEFENNKYVRTHYSKSFSKTFFLTVL